MPRYDRLAELRNGKARFGEWYYGPQKRLLTAYTLNLKGATKLYDNSRIIAAFQNIEESRHDRNYQSSTRNNRTENVKVLSLNADFEKVIGKNELRYGAEITHNTVSSSAVSTNINTSTESPISTRYPSNGSNMRNIGCHTHLGN